MNFSTVCIAEVAGRTKGTGRSSKSQSGAEQELFWASADFSFTSKTTAIDQANWDAGVLAGTLAYIGVIEEFDANDVEATFYESPNGNLRIKTAKAKRVRQYRLVECSLTHASLQSYDGQTGRLFIRTSNGYLKARLEADGTVTGRKVNQFDVGLLTASTSDTPAFTPIDVTFATPIDDDQDVFEDSIDFEFSQVDQVFNANFTISTVTQAGTLNFLLSAANEAGTAIAGILEADLIVKDVNGNVLVKTVTPNGDDYDVVVTTALSSAVISIDGNKLIGSVIYTAADYEATV